ncbi:MAG TPA: hypothetical protein VFQ40_09490 [Actinomycetota bacterium]|nr:hypothetical protein [Actinomycetota bacterium]
MRRGTMIALIVLTLLLTGAATWQIIIASQDREPYPPPTSVTPGP